MKKVREYNFSPSEFLAMALFFALFGASIYEIVSIAINFLK